MVEMRRFSFVKPTINTPFHIDFDWWKDHDNNWRVFLHSCLCSTHQALFPKLENEDWIDWVDPVTAEVLRVDGLQQILMSHCAKEADFVTGYTTLVEGVFRAFLTNGNSPMTPLELGAVVSKPAETILRTLSGPTIYKGIRPCH